MSTLSRPVATYARFYGPAAPDLAGEGKRTWIARGANFVVVVSTLRAGVTLERASQVDEHFVFLPDTGATIQTDSERVEAGAESLLIVPPGSSRVTAHNDGLVVRIFSRLASDLLALASNSAQYADGAPGVAPLVPWPEPSGGYRLRHYRLADHSVEGSNMRVFRSTNLMVNALQKRPVARDPKRLSPHSHVDFEQGSLAVSGTYVHHCRYPWTADSTTWREDEHVELGSPSLMVVPPGVIHTSRNVGDETGWLIDIFSPPRVDFSLRSGLVRNADEYPLPPGLQA